MATSQTQLTQQEIDKLNSQFDLLEDKLNNIGSLLSDKLTNKISDLKDEARDFVNRFEKGEDVTKKLNAKLSTVQKDLNKLSLNRIKLENDLVRVQQQGNVDAELAIKKALSKNKLASGLLEEIQTELITLQRISEEEKKITEEKKKQGTVGKVLEVLGITNLFTFKSILDTFFKLDNQATQIGKSLGISKDAAMEMRKEMTAYANASGDAFVTGERLAKAQEGLTEQLGIAVDFGNEERETFARLTELTGLSADEAGKLAAFSASTGKSTKAYVSDLRVAGMEASRANKIHISDKELLSSVAKLSAGILVKFQGNPKALAQAVVEAKKLGTNLETIDKIGDSLLDWESSINNELEAELITGRKINLERAREAALSGNQLDLTREIADQVGSLSDYQNMNVIAQQSLAKAFGLSRDEMSEMLMKQEAINKYGDKAADLNAEQLEEMERRNMTAEQYVAYVENQRSTQEKFNDLMTKFQETLANIAAGPLGTILGMFASLLESSMALRVVIGAIALIWGGQMAIGLGKTIAQLGVALGLSTAKAAAELTAASALTLGIGTIAIVAAVAGAMAGLQSLFTPKTMKDGIIGPSGKILYSGAEGAIKLDDQDTIIAGTNLGGGRRSTGGGGGGDNNALLAAIDSLHSTMKNKSNDIYMDGAKVGKGVARQQVTGQEQSMNSYSLA